MHENIVIRNETENDYRIVENITRKAFWNLYIPGCNEHYLVNIMRAHEDFVAELDFVIELNNQVIGNIMFTKAKLVDDNGEQKSILTFGPVSILPQYQRKGYGKMLIEHAFERAVQLGYDIIVIFGNPENYVGRGFKSCKKFNISMTDDTFPTAMMAKELVANALDGRKWHYYDSPVMNVDEKEAEIFDSNFEVMEKKVLPSQEQFYILSSSLIRND